MITMQRLLATITYYLLFGSSYGETNPNEIRSESLQLSKPSLQPTKAPSIIIQSSQIHKLHQPIDLSLSPTSKQNPIKAYTWSPTASLSPSLAYPRYDKRKWIPTSTYAPSESWSYYPIKRDHRSRKRYRKSFPVIPIKKRKKVKTPANGPKSKDLVKKNKTKQQKRNKKRVQKKGKGKKLSEKKGKNNKKKIGNKKKKSGNKKVKNNKGKIQRAKRRL